MCGEAVPAAFCTAPLPVRIDHLRAQGASADNPSDGVPCGQTAASDIGRDRNFPLLYCALAVSVSQTEGRASMRSTLRRRPRIGSKCNAHRVLLQS